MTIIIRDVTKEDAWLVSQVNIQIWRESYSDFIDKRDLESLNLDEMASRRHAFYAAKHKHHLNLIIEERHQIIGFCEGGPPREPSEYAKGEIYTLYIRQSHQGRGFGKSLFLYALKELRKQHLSPILVGVLRENRKSMAFYEYMG